jgi:hypothetical protein
MKAGERGGVGPHTEVEFPVEYGRVVARKRAHRSPLLKWAAYCARKFRESGYGSVDQYIDEVRGRL